MISILIWYYFSNKMDFLLRWEVLVLIFLYILWSVSRKLQLISDITKRHVFITGCDSGFGKQLAIKLDKKGVNVYAGCYLEKSVDFFKDKCSQRLKPVLIDVTDSDSVRKAAQFVKNDLGNKALWGLVNNAGIAGATGPIEFLTKKLFKETLDINLLGVVDVTLAFIPLIKKGKEGRIVNISSIFGRIANMSGGYALSKYGIEAFSDGLSMDLCHYGITVHTLNPGFFNTFVTSEIRAMDTYKQMWEDLSPQIREEFGDDYLPKLMEVGKKFLKLATSPDTYKVVNAYTDALLKKYPNNRYTVGWDAKLFYIPLSYLPYLWQKSVFQLMQKMNGTLPPKPKFCKED